MGVNVTFDPDVKIMYVTTVPVSGVSVSDPTGFYVDLGVKADFYSDAKEDWASDPYLNQFLFPMSSTGGDELPGEKDLGATYFLEYGWKIEPYNSDHTFRINGNLYARDGSSPFLAPATGTVMVINTVSNLVDSTVSQLKEIEYSSFGGGVSVDIVNGIPGIAYPAGNKEFPCDSIQNAVIIAEDRGFDKIFIIGNITLGAGDNIDGYIIEGQNAGKTAIIVEDAANCVGCEFQECYITGILDGGSIIRNSIIGDLSYVNGVIFNSMLNPGTITLGGSTTAHFLDCYSGVPGVGTPTIDFDGGTNSLAMRSYAGGIELTNKLTSGAVSIDLESGQVVLDSSVTQGQIVLRGVGKLTDKTTPQAGLEVLADDLINKQNISDAVWDRTSGIQRLIESQKALPMYGEFIYVDYTNGLSGNSGLTPDEPVHSVQWAHDNLIEDSRGDIIFLLDTKPGGTDIDEQWHFTKDHFAVRGAGWDTTLYPSTPSGATITIEASEIELGNFQVRTASTSTSAGGQFCIDLKTKSDLCLFQNMKIKRAQDGGINIFNSDGIVVRSCILEHFTDSVGIHLHGDSQECIFEDNFIYDMKYGLEVEDTAAENWLKKNLFHDMYCGVYIVDSTVGHLYIDRDGTFGNLGVALLNPHNVEEVIYFREEESEATAQRTWDVPLSSHQVSGSTGIEQTAQAYNGWIVYHETDGISGTTYPVGTQSSPVNNIADALQIAYKYGLNTLHTHSDITIPSGTVFDHGYITSHDIYEHTVTIDAGTSFYGMTFQNVKVTGVLDDNASFENCLILDMTEFTGQARGCRFYGDVHFKSPSTHVCVIENCSGFRRSGARFHLYDSTQNFQGWTGYLDLHDKTGLGETNINLNPGLVTVDSTCVSGSILIVGEGSLDNQTGGTVVITSNLLSLDSIADATWSEQLSGHTDAGSAGDSLANVSAGANPLDIADAVWEHATGQSLSADVQFIKSIEGGRWKVDGVQMIFYAEDNATEVARFDLFDEFGQPNAEAVFQRFRV